MGFFSWNCKQCGESIKAPYNLPKDIGWHNDAVVITEGSNIYRGSYDGYGSINGVDFCFDTVPHPEMWHDKCWFEAGSPLEFSGASDYARDQGFFYDYPEEEEQ